MHRTMHPVEVSVENGLIYITQESHGTYDQVVCLHPDQVDILIRWLQEARNELETDES